MSKAKETAFLKQLQQVVKDVYDGYAGLQILEKEACVKKARQKGGPLYNKSLRQFIERNSSWFRLDDSNSCYMAWPEVNQELPIQQDNGDDFWDDDQSSVIKTSWCPAGSEKTPYSTHQTSNDQPTVPRSNSNSSINNNSTRKGVGTGKDVSPSSVRNVFFEYGTGTSSRSSSKGNYGKAKATISPVYSSENMRNRENESEPQRNSEYAKYWLQEQSSTFKQTKTIEWYETSPSGNKQVENMPNEQDIHLVLLGQIRAAVKSEYHRCGYATLSSLRAHPDICAADRAGLFKLQSLSSLLSSFTDISVVGQKVIVTDMYKSTPTYEDGLVFNQQRNKVPSSPITTTESIGSTTGNKEDTTISQRGSETEPDTSINDLEILYSTDTSSNQDLPGNQDIPSNQATTSNQDYSVDRIINDTLCPTKYENDSLTEANPCETEHHPTDAIEEDTMSIENRSNNDKDDAEASNKGLLYSNGAGMVSLMHDSTSTHTPTPGVIVEATQNTSRSHKYSGYDDAYNDDDDDDMANTYEPDQSIYQKQSLVKQSPVTSTTSGYLTPQEHPEHPDKSDEDPQRQAYNAEYLRGMFMSGSGIQVRFTEMGRVFWGEKDLEESPLRQYGTLGTLDSKVPQSDQAVNSWADYHNKNEKEDEQDDNQENELFFLNTQEPFCAVAVGAQGSGKSHTLLTIIENCMLHCAPVTSVPTPTSTLVFHYDTDPNTICEATSLGSPNLSMFPPGFNAPCIENVIVLVSPYFYHQRVKRYSNQPNCTVYPLLFNWDDLTFTHLKTLLCLEQGRGEQPSYVPIVVEYLRNLQKQGHMPTFDVFAMFVRNLIAGKKSLEALSLRMHFLESFLMESQENNSIPNRVSLDGFLQPGTLVIADLTDPMLEHEEVNTIFQ
eukprot:Ihof_evm4s156 gene=Ihof_evmTU4s156